MNYRIPGLSSIILFFIATGIAVYQLFTVSLLSGAIYFIFLPLGFLILLYFYCRKCPHVMDNSCRHVLFGWIVRKMYAPLKPSGYKPKEIIFALSPLVLLVAFPQYFLLRRFSLFVCYWILMLIAVIIVLKGVCPACRNTNCKFCPNRTRLS